ncbi:MAG: hypothetical protein J6J93_02675 [Muribaculaceae bacterium]|nr:hypothetical protein [Muribaculaceae bacterium]
MPRIYKPVGPSTNKAAAGPTQTKTASAPAPAVSAPAAPEKPDKKGNSGEK